MPTTATGMAYDVQGRTGDPIQAASNCAESAITEEGGEERAEEQHAAGEDGRHPTDAEQPDGDQTPARLLVRAGGVDRREVR